MQACFQFVFVDADIERWTSCLCPVCQKTFRRFPIFVRFPLRIGIRGAELSIGFRGEARCNAIGTSC